VTDPLVGLGFDVHAFAPGRPMMLGGILVDGQDGLAGHSDGDVVCHALADAMLGAAALGDLGEHFPDTDPAFAGIGGLELLGLAAALVRDSARQPVSADLTVIADRPAIGPIRDRMRRGLGEALGIASDRVSVKATRPEGLGLTDEGVGCIAIVVLATA